MNKNSLVVSFAIFSSGALGAHVGAVPYQAEENEINVLKGLDSVQRPSKTTMPDFNIGFYAQTNEHKRSYLTCETRAGQKFSEGDFGYAGCLNEKKDSAKMQGVAPAQPTEAGPSLESLRFNFDHIINF